MTIVDSLRFWATRSPERPAIVHSKGSVSWADLDARTDRLAVGLSQLGVAAGDVVAVLLRNQIEFAEAMLAVMKLGVVVELLNPRITAAEMVHPIVDAEPKVVISQPGQADLLTQALSTWSASLVLVGAEDGVRSFNHLAESEDSLRASPPSAGDAAMLSYTSGTTGRPKGAILTHSSLVSGALMRATAQGSTWRDSVLIAMPLGFAGGACALLCWGIVPGSTVHLASENDPEAWLRSVSTHKIASWPCVPVAYEMAMRHPTFGDADLSSLRFAVTGGSPVAIHTLRTYLERGVPVTQGYGSTETSGTYAALAFPDEAESRYGTTGRPLLHMDIRVVDDDDLDVETGAAGEILLRGPNLFREYHRREEATRTAYRNGWFHTGDIGSFDDDGYLSILDRKNDMLISGGLNVYPAEIEAVLRGHGGLDTFAVIGVPDQRWGEVPMLVVESLRGLDVQQIVATSRSELADYKRPRFVAEYGAPLPLTAAGKSLKRELRVRYPSVPDDAVDLKTWTAER